MYNSIHNKGTILMTIPITTPLLKDQLCEPLTNILIDFSADTLDSYLSYLKSGYLSEFKTWEYALTLLQLDDSVEKSFPVLMKYFPDKMINCFNTVPDWVFEQYPEVCCKHIVHIATFQNIKLKYFKHFYHKLTDAQLKFVLSVTIFDEADSLDFIQRAGVQQHLPIGNEVVLKYPMKSGHVLAFKEEYVSLVTCEETCDKLEFKEHSLYSKIESKYISKFIKDILKEYGCSHMFDRIAQDAAIWTNSNNIKGNNNG